MKLRVALCMFLVGCVADPPTLGESEHTLKNAPGDGCTDWECGSNSPVIEAADLWDLPLAYNVVNDRGYKVTFFGRRSQDTYTRYTPDVVNGQLIATRAGVQYDGTEVSGMLWRIVNVNTNKTYELVVTGVGTTPYWSRSNWNAANVPWTWTYKLQWRDFVAQWPHATHGPTLYNVCGENPEDNGMTDFTAVLFEDDWISADTIQVLGERANWFNIGCAGHTLAKQHLTGHTKAAASRMGWTTTVAQRTANLKMLAGDYCGKGFPFTYAGQRLLWRDEWNKYNSTTTTIQWFTRSLEARWDEHGAICLNTPRVDFRTTTKGELYFPDGVESLLVTDATAGWCTEENPRPPPCTGTYTDNVPGAHVTSVNFGPLINPMPM